MRYLYLDLSMGAAGDMLTAALFDLFSENEKKEILEKLNNMGLGAVVFEPEVSEKCGVKGCHMKVVVKGMEEQVDDVAVRTHHGKTLPEIQNIISGLDLPKTVKTNAWKCYKSLAEAESKAHGCDVSEVHFHEVGMFDAIADVAAFCYLIDLINPDKVMASAIRTGFGSVKCAHGILPVPAPATANILQGIPVYAGDIEGEMITPTGAVLVKEFVDSFELLPEMKIEKTGYGMGKKDFEKANLVRAFLGESSDVEGLVVELSCNIDDMTGEEIGFAVEELQKGGVLDVFTAPIFMKKNRPGVLLSVICERQDELKICKLIFKHTKTIGIRKTLCERHTLERKLKETDTAFGLVTSKVSSGYEVTREKLEYENLATIAREENLSILEVKKNLENA